MREKTLIPPIPKEYIYYSVQEKIEKTEQYYDEVRALYLEIESLYEECQKSINSLLETQFGLDELAQVLEKKEVRKLCHYKYEVALLEKLYRIAQFEEAFGEPYFIRKIHNLEQVVDSYHRILFLIRRFEFCWEEDNELAELVKHNEVSYICLSELICEREIIQKVKTGCRITEYMYKNGLPRQAVLFLMRLEQKLPYSERKIMHFTMTLLDIGEQQLAYEVLMKHQNPDNDVKNLQSELGKILGI